MAKPKQNKIIMKNVYYYLFFSYRSSRFVTAKVVTLILFASFFCINLYKWFMASFLYCYKYNDMAAIVVALSCS